MFSYSFGVKKRTDKKYKDIRTSSCIAFAPAWVPFPPSTKSISILLAYKNQIIINHFLNKL